MKKRIIYFMCSILLLGGCTDSFLDVENWNELDESSFFKTEYDLQIAVNAAYCPLAHAGTFGQAWMNVLFGTLDDRQWFEGYSGLDKLVMTSANGSVEGMFADTYRGIYRCSDIIRNIHGDGTPAKPGMIANGYITLEKSKKYEAQLRTLRAMHYFNQVTLFHNPYFYNEKNQPSNPLGNYGNSNPELFWKQINVDLEYATDPTNDLPATQTKWGADDRGRVTRGAAWALWGKARLWKHYYFYLENGKEVDSNGETLEQNLEKAKECFAKVINDFDYVLQGESDAFTGTKDQQYQNILNALLSNSTFVPTIDDPKASVKYKGENNNESIWEIQYAGSGRIGGGGWLPGWMRVGAMNYLYSGSCASFGGYSNFEFDPDAYWVFDVPADGTNAKAVGFDRDPRAYASFYMDVNPLHKSDMLDYRSSAPYYRDFKSGIDSKAQLRPAGIYTGAWPFDTKCVNKKKYSYPQFTNSFDGGDAAPNFDPFNIRVIRFADVLLMYAEACYLSGSDGMAGSGLEALNRVRSRAGMQPVTMLDEATIIKERDMELMGEGFRYLDIVRWSRAANWFDAINFSINVIPGYNFKENFTMYTTSDPNILYRNMYLPIPLNEINKNNGTLKQNPGW